MLTALMLATTMATPSVYCLRDRASETATGTILIAFGAALGVSAIGTGVGGGAVLGTGHGQEVLGGALIGVAVVEVIGSLLLIGFGRDAVIHGQDPCIGDDRLGMGMPRPPLDAAALAARWMPPPDQLASGSSRRLTWNTPRRHERL
jgi:hypothetical protein